MVHQKKRMHLKFFNRFPQDLQFKKLDNIIRKNNFNRQSHTFLYYENNNINRYLLDINYKSQSVATWFSRMCVFFSIN